MLIDKKRRLIAVPAKRRIKNYSSTHGGGGTAVILYGNFDVSCYFDRSVFLTASRTFRTNVGETESSSMPMRKNVSVRVVSAASSPHIPIHAPFLWAFCALILIRRRIASW